MKKALLILLVLGLTTLTANSAALDTGTWYQYNGYSTAHSFSVLFPPTWKALTFGNDSQSFAPEAMNDGFVFSIKEFEGKTYYQAMTSFAASGMSLQSVEDIVIQNGADILAKRATYLNLDNAEEMSLTFIKRGSLIISLTDPVEGEYKDIMSGIYGSFSFKDKWHQYIDYGENYTFSFPSNLEITNLSNGVKLSDPIQFDAPVFSVLKYADTPLADAPKAAEGYNENFIEKRDIVFHGLSPVVGATYEDLDQNKQFSRIFVEYAGNSYGITDINIENNFPHLNYYDDYIVEILESFEFFDVDVPLATYANFPDVRDGHLNAIAINSLTKSKVIAGYPDGTFKPDGEINRAELTKMIVATKLTPNVADYNECFSDVHKEWFAPFICYAEEKGWVEGYPDGKFRPEQNINRVEALKIILGVIFSEIPENGTLNDTSVADIGQGEWYEKYFILADNKDLLDKQHITTEGSKYFYYPGENITRKEVAETIYRASKSLLLP